MLLHISKVYPIYTQKLVIKGLRHKNKYVIVYIVMRLGILVERSICFSGILVQLASLSMAEQPKQNRKLERERERYHFDNMDVCW